MAPLLAGLTQAKSAAAPYFAWWNWCTQLALALAAGATLPLLALLGYQPGSAAGGAATGYGVAPPSTEALAAAYALLPCALKLLAWLLLTRAATHSLKHLNRREP
jgi:glycoside/pentoside/hexuronide:cation symporter, GPH family